MPYFNFNEYKIYYEIIGQGEPFLVLNGIMMSVRSWDIFIESWSEHNMVIRCDMLDQGLSTKMTTQYTQDLQADMLSALLKYLKIKQVNVFGASYGGSVALNLAIRYPNQVKRLALFNTVAKTNEWMFDIGRGWNLTGKTRNGEAYYKQTIPMIYSPKFYQERLDWMKKREQLLTPIMSHPIFLDAMERLVISAESHDFVQRLSKVKAKTLVLGSEMDYLTPRHEQEILVKGIKDSSFIMLPYVGHASILEVPFLFSSILLGFFNTKDTGFAI